MRITFLCLAICLLLFPAVQASDGWQFGPRTEVPNVNISSHNLSPVLSVDGLTLFFTKFVGPGNHDILITTRETVDDEWADPETLYGDVNSQYYDEGPFLSADGQSLYFTDGLWFWEPSAFREGSRTGDIWISRRESLDEDFGEPDNLGDTVNSEDYDGFAKLSLDGLTLVFDSQRPGGLGATDLWVTHRADQESPWQEPENLGPIVNSQYHDVQPALSPDGLSLFFSSDRPGGIGGYDIWVASRESTNDEWDAPEPLDENINSAFHEGEPFLTADWSALYIAASDGPSLAQGPYNIFQATRLGPEIPVLTELQAGDADQDFDFDQLDLVRVQQAAKYLTGQSATWGDGDWDGAPGGELGSPPSGNGLFDQFDLISALTPAHYLKGKYAALSPGRATLRDDTLAIPEPSSIVLIGITLVGALSISSRHRMWH